MHTQSHGATQSQAGNCQDFKGLGGKEHLKLSILLDQFSQHVSINFTSLLYLSGTTHFEAVCDVLNNVAFEHYKGVYARRCKRRPRSLALRVNY